MGVISPARPIGHPGAEAAAPVYRRVLIVDDSAVARAVLARLIDASDEWSVARAVHSVEAAMAFLATDSVDIILLDINLPGTDGLTALPDLRAAAPGAKVIAVSGDAAAGVQALALGAADALTKPGPGGFTSHLGEALLDSLSRLADGVERCPATRPAPVKTPLVAVARPASLPDPIAGTARASAFDIVAIGASTGGIHALSGVIRRLPATCRVPILVTQHLPASFMPYFAAQLALLAGRPCEVATDRMRIRPGRIIVAPGDAHLVAVSLGEGAAALRLSRTPSASGCLPSVDPMLASLAPLYGDRLLAVMLSGMGRDGIDGARSVHAAGGCVVAQDVATSVVWGMPGAVVGAGIAAAVLPPERIGALIATGRRPS